MDKIYQKTHRLIFDINVEILNLLSYFIILHFLNGNITLKFKFKVFYCS